MNWKCAILSGIAAPVLVAGVSIVSVFFIRWLSEYGLFMNFMGVALFTLVSIFIGVPMYHNCKNRKQLKMKGRN